MCLQNLELKPIFYFVCFHAIFCHKKMTPVYILTTPLDSVVNFKPFNPEDGLPYPLNVGKSRLPLTIVLVVILTFGFRLRLAIFRYLKTVDVRVNPINVYIWIDQLNGVLLGINLMAVLIMLYLPYPLSTIIGYSACNWFDFSGNMYLSGK